jgi:hypothetical protein
MLSSFPRRRPFKHYELFAKFTDLSEQVRWEEQRLLKHLQDKLTATPTSVCTGEKNHELHV